MISTVKTTEEVNGEIRPIPWHKDGQRIFIKNTEAGLTGN